MHGFGNYKKSAVFFLEGGFGNQAAITAHALAHIDPSVSTRISVIKYTSKLERRNFSLATYFDLEKINLNFSARFADKYIYIFLRLVAKIRNKDAITFNILNTQYNIGYFQTSMFENFHHLKPYLKIQTNSTPELSVHVRRGDYTLAHHDMHGLIRVSDVKRIALEVLRDQNITIINVISEDMEVYNDFINDERFGNYDLVNLTAEDELTVFTQMLTSSILIGTNSTFSLLAGALFNGELWVPAIWDRLKSSEFLGPAVNRYEASFVETAPNAK